MADEIRKIANLRTEASAPDLPGRVQNEEFVFEGNSTEETEKYEEINMNGRECRIYHGGIWKHEQRHGEYDTGTG